MVLMVVVVCVAQNGRDTGVVVLLVMNMAVHGTGVIGNGTGNGYNRE